jgi:hypothetical protein
LNGSTRFVPSPACDYQPDDPLIIPAVRQQRRLSELRELASAGDPRAPAANGAAVDEVLATLIDGRVIVTRTTAARGEPNGLALNDQQAVALQTVDLYSAGDADDGGLIFAGGEVAGLLGGSWAGPIGPVADEESGIEDLEQEGGQGQVSLVRGESPP